MPRLRPVRRRHAGRDAVVGMKIFTALGVTVLLAGCSGLASQLAPAAPNAAAARQAAGQGRNNGLVYVSDLQNDTVWICPANFENIEDGYVAATGQLQGIQNPSQLAVDSHGTIYVANAQIDASGTGQIAEYPRGATSPSTTLTSGLNTTTGVAVDSNGNVYASNKFLGTVVMFPKGKSTPSKTFHGKLSGPDGLALDAANDLFIADGSANEVFEVAHGSSAPRSLGLHGIQRPIGIAVDSKNNLYVSNLLGASSTVTVYSAGSTNPKETIVVPGPLYGSERTIAEPAMLSITKPGDILIVSAPITLALVSSEEYFGYLATTVAYARGSTTPLWSNTNTTGTDAIFQPGK
jgi:hypothetical protein